MSSFLSALRSTFAYLPPVGNHARVRRRRRFTQEMTEVLEDRCLLFAGAIDVLAGDPLGLGTSQNVMGAWDLDLGPNDDVYFSDAYWDRIFRLDGDSAVSVIAGGGDDMDWDDGDNALDLRLFRPEFVVDDFGNAFLADPFEHRLFKIDSTGSIELVAGGGTDEDWDGTEQARDLKFDGFELCDVDDDGNVYVIDRARIVRLVPDGSIELVAGGGDENITVSGVDAGHQTTTSRCTNCGTGVVIRKLHSFSRKLVNVRSLKQFLAVAGKISIASIVQQNVNDVGLRSVR